MGSNNLPDRSRCLEPRPLRKRYDTKNIKNNFTAGFKESVLLFQIEEMLCQSLQKASHANLTAGMKRRQRQSNVLTPRARLSVIDRNRWLKTFIWRYTRRYGPPKPLLGFFERLRSKASLKVLHVTGKRSMISDRTLLRIWQKIRY